MGGGIFGAAGAAGGGGTDGLPWICRGPGEASTFDLLLHESASTAGEIVAGPVGCGGQVFEADRDARRDGP